MQHVNMDILNRLSTTNDAQQAERKKDIEKRWSNSMVMVFEEGGKA